MRILFTSHMCTQGRERLGAGDGEMIRASDMVYKYSYSIIQK